MKDITEEFLPHITFYLEKFGGAYKVDMATSIKSLNDDASSYQNAATLNRALSGYIDSVAGYNETGPNGWAKVILNLSGITGRSLDLVIPDAGSATQQQTIAQAVQYGASKGVQVNVIIYP